MKLIILTLLFVIFILYNRYFPIFGIRCIRLKDLEIEKMNVIDVRDFNESYKNPIEGAINIPIAYLKRNIHEVPKRDLHLIVSNSLEKNVATRFLRKKGYRVIGYSLLNNNKLMIEKNPLETNC